MGPNQQNHLHSGQAQPQTAQGIAGYYQSYPIGVCPTCGQYKVSQQTYPFQAQCGSVQNGTT